MSKITKLQAWIQYLLDNTEYSTGKIAEVLSVPESWVLQVKQGTF